MRSPQQRAEAGAYMAVVAMALAAASIWIISSITP